MNRDAGPCLCGALDCPRCYPGNVRYSRAARRWVEKHQDDPQGEELEADWLEAQAEDEADRRRER